MNHQYSFFIIFLLCASACCENDQEPESEPEYILFGHFYGYCQGEQCIEIFKLTDTQLLEDTNDLYPSREEPYEGNFVELDQSKFDLVKSIAQSIPDELLDEQSNVIGSPDASDGGGVYIAIVGGGETRFWLIDQFRQNIPAYLHPFMQQVNESIDLINN